MVYRLLRVAQSSVLHDAVLLQYFYSFRSVPGNDDSLYSEVTRYSEITHYSEITLQTTHNSIIATFRGQSCKCNCVGLVLFISLRSGT